ncbi:MAG: hypothetical protein HYS80_02525, partial [Candidatus Aenigmarchaeota archaeon]|nr:hypothetical protein [Candidatus Aenigmarchaeota archaeon]
MLYLKSMLTQDDLQKIGELIKVELITELTPIKEDISILKLDVGTLKTDVGTL